MHLSSLYCKCLYKSNEHGKRTQTESYRDLFSILLQQSLFPTYTHTHPFVMCEEILEINLSQIFTLQTHMFLKEIQLWPVALSTCLLFTCWERPEKRSSYVAWNWVQGDNSLICQNSKSLWRINPEKELVNIAQLQLWISLKVWWTLKQRTVWVPLSAEHSWIFWRGHTFLDQTQRSSCFRSQRCWASTFRNHSCLYHLWILYAVKHFILTFPCYIYLCYSLLYKINNNSNAFQLECISQDTLTAAFSKFLCYPQTGNRTPAVIPDKARTATRGKAPLCYRQKNTSIGCSQRKSCWAKKSCFLSEEDIVFLKQTWKNSNTSFNF